ncbi:MAG: hypothetical protein V2A62_03470 [Candidatus Woesearchaeota archaeon]
MLTKNELKVLKLLLSDLTRELNIMDVAKALDQKYVQTYQTVKLLVKSVDVVLKKVGKSKILKPDFSQSHSNYLLAEMERTNEICKKNTLAAIVKKNILEVNKNFICILFGSQTVKPKPNSDIDLLFVIPKEYDFNEFEKIVRNKLIAVNADIVIVPESSLHEMWANPQKLNVGNELLKKHIILYGAEHFWNLWRRHHVG